MTIIKLIQWRYFRVEKRCVFSSFLPSLLMYLFRATLRFAMATSKLPLDTVDSQMD